MSKEKKYWKGLEDFQENPDHTSLKHKEFPEEIPVDEFLGNENIGITSTHRRDFLKLLGFSVTAATLASCEAPVTKAMPYLFKPEEITPGVANWYASAYFDGNDYCDVLIKTREGRPIKIEGNSLSLLTKGGVNARVQASVLSLYDSERLKGPLAKGEKSDWKSIDHAISNKLASIAETAGEIRLLSSSIISPSTHKLIAGFKEKYPSARHITYDAVSNAAIAYAHKQQFGKAVIPSFRFNNADIILSLGADFLVNWLSPLEHSAQYIQNRKVGSSNKRMSRHIQIETILSVTGSNADERIAVKPSEASLLIPVLYNELAALSGKAKIPAEIIDQPENIKAIASELWENKGKALVVSGSNDTNIQFIVAEINKILDSYGKTIDIEKPHYLRQGNDREVFELLDEMKQGKIKALFVMDSNPAYTLAPSLEFENALSKVDLRVSFADRLDETAALMDYVCPGHHQFESWNDANPAKGLFALSQPVISHLFNTRPAQESLLLWMGQPDSYYSYLQKFWEEEIFPSQENQAFFQDFWNKCLHDGVVGINTEKTFIPEPALELEEITISGAAGFINKEYRPIGGFEIVLYEKTGIGNGTQANNPWLQELPDPISKICWDNYLAMSPKQMSELGFHATQGQEEEADLVEITVNGTNLRLPVLASPGQAYGSGSIALGYGRVKAGKAANNVGLNAYSFSTSKKDNINYTALDGNLSGSVGKYHLASTQTHHTMMGRSIVKETTLEDYIKNPSAGNAPLTYSVKEGKENVQKPAKELSLWQAHEENGHIWNLSIDLNSCIGCGACVVSCQAENNVPVVGKDEVRRGREMHWLRIDRYYSSDAPKTDISGMEIPSENPQVVYQPVMCQHCNHAPCETVCPVIATSHSTDGLNQMIYNRCVGTRYCANNCPYKVRRFNWFSYSDNKEFDFNMNNDLGKMVLNPDVVVRSRGVMEKCSMCVQRIQEGKLKAKRENRKLEDGEIQTACAQSCPTKAFTFGDINLKDSGIAKVKSDERRYFLLEEVGVRPNVFYLTKVRNRGKLLS